MAYVYERFGSVTLPAYNRDTDLAPVGARNSLVTTLAGSFDAAGTGRSRQALPQVLSVKASVTAATAAAWRSALDELRALVGVRAALYRRGDDDSLHRCAARLVAMPHVRSVRNKRHVEVSLQLQQLGPWEGDRHTGWTLDDGEILDDGLMLDPMVYLQAVTASPSTQNLVNGGNLPQTDVVISVTAGSGSLSGIAITGPGVDLRLAGTLGIGGTLLIDCGAQQVTINGVDAYASFSLGANHTRDEWCVLEPGATALALAASGVLTGANWTIEFADRWA